MGFPGSFDWMPPWEKGLWEILGQLTQSYGQSIGLARRCLLQGKCFVLAFHYTQYFEWSRILVQGKTNWRCKLAWKCGKCATVSTCGLNLVVQYLYKSSTLFALTLRSGGSHVGSLLMKRVVAFCFMSCNLGFKVDFVLSAKLYFHVIGLHFTFHYFLLRGGNIAKAHK